jgi:hypothetical protein
VKDDKEVETKNQSINFKNIVMKGKYVTTLVLLAALSAGGRKRKSKKIAA